MYMVLAICYNGKKRNHKKEQSANSYERKDLQTGTETYENIAVSTDENVLNADGYRVEGIEPNIIIGTDEMPQQQLVMYYMTEIMNDFI